jgi:alkylation response protein AidB-like acyl-CoA dehydrogenase
VEVFVDFALSAEQEALGRTVRDVLSAHGLPTDSSGYSPELWSVLADQLGVNGLAIPEEYGGSGATLLDQGVVLHETGRSLLPAPYLATVGMAAPVLVAAADPAANERWLRGIASGELTATAVIPPPGGEPTVRAELSSDGLRLDGEAGFVVDGHRADLLVVPARGRDGLVLAVVEGTATGLVREELAVLDVTRAVAKVTFTATPATALAPTRTPAQVWAEALDRIAVLLAAEQVGVAERALELAVEYAKTRTQFGRTIGSFQAVKHLLADVALEVEAARSAAWYALWVADADPDAVPVAASIAAATCAEAAYRAAAECIQVHGGIGVTWEHPAHLYFKRATTSRLLLGDPAHHREQLLVRVGF